MIVEMRACDGKSGAGAAAGAWSMQSMMMRDGRMDGLCFRFFFRSV